MPDPLEAALGLGDRRGRGPPSAFSVAAISAGSESNRLLPSMARKSEVKLLRSPSTRVFGSHSSATSADRPIEIAQPPDAEQAQHARPAGRTTETPPRGGSGSNAAAAWAPNHRRKDRGRNAATFAEISVKYIYERHADRTLIGALNSPPVNHDLSASIRSYERLSLWSNPASTDAWLKLARKSSASRTTARPRR